MNILLSSCGRRVSLLNCFRQSLAEMGCPGLLGGVDASLSAPARIFVDFFEQVPRCGDRRFVEVVRGLCGKTETRLIVPTIDTELPVLTASRGLFASDGVLAAVSSPETIEICGDKWKTFRWLRENGFPSVPRALLECVHEARWKFPLVVKPRAGSASLGVRQVADSAELRLIQAQGKGLVVEPWLEGEEYTVNVFVDRRGRCLAAVPHLRLEVRAGEVAKAVTVKHAPLMSLARRIAESLPGAFGPLNIQFFALPDGGIHVIEINARFGGGYPLCHQAGGVFTRWLIEEALGLDTVGPGVYSEAWRDQLAMLRHDHEVFLPGPDVFGSIASSASQAEEIPAKAS